MESTEMDDIDATSKSRNADNAWWWKMIAGGKGDAGSSTEPKSAGRDDIEANSIAVSKSDEVEPYTESTSKSDGLNTTMESSLRNEDLISILRSDDDGPAESSSQIHGSFLLLKMLIGGSPESKDDKPEIESGSTKDDVEDPMEVKTSGGDGPSLSDVCTTSDEDESPAMESIPIMDDAKPIQETCSRSDDTKLSLDPKPSHVDALRLLTGIPSGRSRERVTATENSESRSVVATSLQRLRRLLTERSEGQDNSGGSRLGSAEQWLKRRLSGREGSGAIGDASNPRTGSRMRGVDELREFPASTNRENEATSSTTESRARIEDALQWLRRFIRREGGRESEVVENNDESRTRSTGVLLWLTRTMRGYETDRKVEPSTAPQWSARDSMIWFGHVFSGEAIVKDDDGRKTEALWLCRKMTLALILLLLSVIIIAPVSTLRDKKGEEIIDNVDFGGEVSLSPTAVPLPITVAEPTSIPTAPHIVQTSTPAVLGGTLSPSGVPDQLPSTDEPSAEKSPSLLSSTSGPSASVSPSDEPSLLPTNGPTTTRVPSSMPSILTTLNPTSTQYPSFFRSALPTGAPSESIMPSAAPSQLPTTSLPSEAPSESAAPTFEARMNLKQIVLNLTERVTTSSDLAAEFLVQTATDRDVERLSQTDNLETLKQQYALLALDIATSGMEEPTIATSSGLRVECLWENVDCEDRVVTGVRWMEQNRSGSIPVEIGLLSEVSHLDLGDNQLTGSIPESFFNLTSMTHLYLHNNRLTGSISDSIFNQQQLLSLYLGGNMLSGTFPDGLRSKSSRLVDLRPMRKLSFVVINVLTSSRLPQSSKQLTFGIPTRATQLAKPLLA